MDSIVGDLRSRTYPLGASVTVKELDEDPYPIYARLREREPVSWLPALNMWYVTRYEDVRSAMLDVPRLTTVSAQSTILDTFGSHMLTTEDPLHDRYRRAAQYPFAPSYIRAHFETAIGVAAHELIDKIGAHGGGDLRASFAARLPVKVILLVCGLPSSAEADVRRWYDSFEAALANFSGDAAIRSAAQANVREFHAMLGAAMRVPQALPTESLLRALASAPADVRLSDEEIKRNLSIIFFGGISTVEALLLNCLWALFEHPETFERVRADFTLLPKVIEETMRWLSPVQSATRHVVATYSWQGAEFRQGETVNCMLGAANRDQAVFARPDVFDIDRENVRRHLGFATGPHSCLGANLAKAEARIGLAALFARLPRIAIVRDASEAPRGYEFRQSRRLVARWDR
jgi:cytochrome P450